VGGAGVWEYVENHYSSYLQISCAAHAGTIFPMQSQITISWYLTQYADFPNRNSKIASCWDVKSRGRSNGYTPFPCWVEKMHRPYISDIESKW